MKAFYHLPGLFEFYELYRVFLPLFRAHREYFYDWCEIGSIYGAPADCLWGGGRVGFGEDRPEKVAELMREYGISSRLTFSNSLLREEHLSDRKCNSLCSLFEKNGAAQNGVILSSDLLLGYLRKNYPGFYFVSSTTKVLTGFQQLEEELNRGEFRYVVPDFRLNKVFDRLNALNDDRKQKVEFLCNECCWFACPDRKKCYEVVSRKNLGEDCAEHECVSPEANRGYRFSDAMKNPGFIGIEDIQKIYLPNGFSHFKIEGRSLGSAVILEFLLYYLTKPEHQLKVREEIYLDSTLDLF
jgi:collagenase-like PrtC family protease